MNIKTKLRLGFGFLFIIVITFGAISLYHINQISMRSKIVLKDNYKSLVYVNQMRSAIDNQTYLDSIQFGSALKSEQANVTEPGEREAFLALKNAFHDKNNRRIREELRNIEKINMNAIVRKNDDAQKATEKATLYLGLTASLTFIILFSFIVNFPSFIANPLRELLEGIQEISRKNYKQRLEFKSSDEFNEVAIAFNKMALELRNWDNTNIAKIKSEKQRIETIIEQMQDAIIGLNEHQDILFLNRVAGQLLNVNTADVIGKNANEILKKNDLLKRILSADATEEPLKIYADEKESYFQLENREITIPTFTEGEEAPLQTSFRSAGMVYVLKNITKFKELDEAKTNFIATVSHELKTPLSSIKMSLKLLDDARIGEMNSEQTQLIRHINEDSDRLLKITGELLDLAQVETGNLQLNLTNASPANIVELAVSAVTFQAQQKQITIETEIAQNLPPVHVDIQKTTWVLVNLLSNAMRYSVPKSKVIVSACQKDQFVEFSVKDFGKGIEEQYQRKLFDRYYQVPTDGQNRSGTGLGLAISKDFIEAENGHISLESALGEGSRFSFILPKSNV